MIDKALRHVPTFEELIGILERDRTKIKLPERTALHFFDSPLYQQVLETEEKLDGHETRVHEHHVHNHEVKQMASETGVSAAEIRTIMKEFQRPEPPKPPKRPNDADEQPDDHMPPPPGAGAVPVHIPVPAGPPSVFRPMTVNPQIPPPPGPPPGAAAQTLAANRAHDERMRQLEREAHLQQLADANRQRENVANVAQAVTASLIAGYTHQQAQAQALHAARERAIEEAAARRQTETHQQAAARELAHIAQMEQMRQAAEALRPRVITSPENVYIGGTGVRSHTNAKQGGDISRTRANTRKNDGDDGTIEKKKPPARPNPPSRPVPPDPRDRAPIGLPAPPPPQVKPTTKADPPASRPKTRSYKHADARGDTTRAPATRRSLEGDRPTQPSRRRPRTGGVVSKKVGDIEDGPTKKIRTVPVGR